MKHAFSPFLAAGGAALLAVLSSGCHRPPQTAEELRQALPRQFAGEVHWQGETESQRLRLVSRSLTVRGAHLLEFEGARVALLDAQGRVVSENEAAVRGTISAPGFEVRIETLGASGGGEDLLKPGSFAGKLSDDLQSVEASWTNAFGGKGSLRLRAEPGK